jgi:hypothetical protein
VRVLRSSPLPSLLRCLAGLAERIAGSIATSRGLRVAQHVPP